MIKVLLLLLTLSITACPTKVALYTVREQLTRLNASLWTPGSDMYIGPPGCHSVELARFGVFIGRALAAIQRVDR